MEKRELKEVSVKIMPKTLEVLAKHKKQTNVPYKYIINTAVNFYLKGIKYEKLA
jgi:hypothetical protein